MYLHERMLAMSRQPKPDGSTRVVCSHGKEYIWEKSNDKWVLQHRLVMSHVLGRELGTHEHVHHKNEDSTDNRQENLSLESPQSHRDVHKPELRPMKPKHRCARDGCNALIPASEHKKYCSVKCRFYATHVTVTCHMCGERFIAYRVHRKKFCSRSCARQYPNAGTV